MATLTAMKPAVRLLLRAWGHTLPQAHCAVLYIVLVRSVKAPSGAAVKVHQSIAGLRTVSGTIPCQAGSPCMTHAWVWFVCYAERSHLCSAGDTSDGMSSAHAAPPQHTLTKHQLHEAMHAAPRAAL